MDTKNIIAQLGGVDGAAAMCGITQSAVYKWHDSGVPPKHWPLIVATTGLPYETLAKTVTPSNPDQP